jgi:POT family proton-dependent oligopeptide transporter
MAKSEYQTAPAQTATMPPGVPYIIGNEAAERFSYYGMNSILVTFMTTYMLTSQGTPDRFSPERANEWYHNFVTAAYGLCIVGAFLADAVWGKFRTVMVLSIAYCLGHFTLALNDTRYGLMLGMGLIALGAGGIKPCVSAIVGDQFGVANQHLMHKVYNWFYFSINAGSAVATMMIPWLLRDERFGPHWAFGVPGVFMLLATIVFWLGRDKFVRVQPDFKAFKAEMFSAEARRSILNLLILVPFVGMFWAIWQQNFSSWVTQAGKMDLMFLGRQWLPEQIQTANPVVLLLMLPLFAYVVYPAIDKVFPLTPLRKIGIGMFLGVVAFLIPTWIEIQLVAGHKPNIGWQLLGYVFLTAAEIMVSVPHLEFCYRQGPKRLKSISLCMYLLAISAGNFFAARVNQLIQNEDGSSKLAGPQYFWFFTGALLVASVLYVFVAKFYKGKDYIQDVQPGT